eukprot:PhF_6_TR10352/c1_g1_i2/m.16006
MSSTFSETATPNGQYILLTEVQDDGQTREHTVSTFTKLVAAANREKVLFQSKWEDFNSMDGSSTTGVLLSFVDDDTICVCEGKWDESPAGSGYFTSVITRKNV